MLRFAASAALAVVLFTELAMAGAGTTTDSSTNGRQLEAPLDAYATPNGEDQIGKHLVRQKHYAEAIPHLELALADKPQDPELLSDLGYAKSMTGDSDSALYYYQRALSVDPNYRGVHQHLGELYLARNDPASAQKELATLASLCPSGCDERDALASAIAGYRPAPAAATSSALGGSH